MGAQALVESPWRLSSHRPRHDQIADELIKAATKGDLPALKRWGLQGCRSHLLDYAGMLLYAAADRNHLEVVRWLLDHTDVGDSQADCDNALTVAADNGHAEVVKLLLKGSSGRGPKLANMYVNNCRPITTAAVRGHKNVVRAFLDDEDFDPSKLDAETLRLVNMSNKDLKAQAKKALTSEARRLVEGMVTEKLSAADKEEVSKLFKKYVKDGELDDYTLKSIQGSLTQLFKMLYQRRGTWKSELSLKQA